MENQHAAKQSLNSRSTMTEPTEAKPTVTPDLIEVKQEFDIKLEEDEVDTIEYTPQSNQLARVFVPKVEKIEPEDSNDDDEVDNPWELFDRFGYLDSFNCKANIMPTPEAGAKTTDTASSSRSHASEENIAVLPWSADNVNNNDGTRTESVTRLHVTTAKKKDAKLKVENALPKVQSKSMNKKKQQLKCIACDYVTPWPGNLKSHMLTHTGEKPFPCKHCPKRYTKKTNLQSHMKKHVKKGSLNCSICLEVFVTNTELLDHEATCKQRRYECHLCKKFTTFDIAELNVHMRVHNGIRPFKCDLCLNKFTNKSNLKKHIKTHTNPRRRVLKFQCSVCAQNFLDRSGRDTHELNCKRRRYECYLCQSYMNQAKSSLQYHMRMSHTGERPFKCKLCTKTYLNCSELNHHMKSHKQY